MLNNTQNNCNSVPSIIKTYKEQNDWKSILSYYNITNFNEKLDENISISELSEIFFAAGHYVYVLNNSSHDKKSFKQVLLLYFWTHDNTKYWLTRYPESPALLRSYAYLNYELSTGFGNTITKKAKRLYESLTDGDKKRMYFSCYIKSLYNYAVYTFDVILPTLSLRSLLNADRYNKTFYVQYNGDNGIKWKNDKIKNAKLYLEKAAQLAHSELKSLSKDEIIKIATIKNPIILPMYFYYTYAKIFYTVSILYTSNKSEFNKYREAHPQESLKKADEYLSLAVKYCQYAVAIRTERKRHGFSDSGGIYPEIGLLGKIYTIICFRTGNGEKISKLYEKNHKNDGIKFYHAVCLYYLDPIKNHDKCIELLKEIKSVQYKTKAEQEINYINNGVSSHIE